MQRKNVGRAAAVRHAAAHLACVSRATGIHPFSPGSTEGGRLSAPAIAPPAAPLRTAAPTALVGAVGSGHDCVPAVANASMCDSNVAAVLACGAAAPGAVGASAAPSSAVPTAATNKLLKRSGDWGWGTTVKWLNGLRLCVCVRMCFVVFLSKAPLFPSRALFKWSQSEHSSPPRRSSSSPAHAPAHTLNKSADQIKASRIKSKPTQIKASEAQEQKM